MTKKQKRMLRRIAVALVLYVIVLLLPFERLLPQPASMWAEFAAFAVPYLIAGYDVLLGAARKIARRRPFDEELLMSIATLGAFALVLFPQTDPHFAEGAAVMLFYQVGELFQSLAVERSRRSIAQMMDIAPDTANLLVDGRATEVDPDDVEVGSLILVRPGERVPIDGVVEQGASQLDTAALTGESLPRGATAGDEVFSGCINLTGALTLRTTKPFGESTVSRILELVENASDKKARTEAFITRFARWYTPIVVLCALAVAILPPLLFGQPWSTWIERGLTFLVVSCPCALVISVPLSFFGGIGGASKLGVLVKGSNYLEALANARTVVFDKTGTLTTGTFSVTKVNPVEDVDAALLVELAAHAEAHSTHPLASAVRNALGTAVDPGRVSDVREESGMGVAASVDGSEVLVGNLRLMEAHGVACGPCEAAGTVLHVAYGGRYLGNLVVADTPKQDAAEALAALRAAGVERTVMLTGDREDVAALIARELGVDEHFSELMPQDKVVEVERLLSTMGPKERLAFVGDGINDAPVLTRADIGIAMGAMGSDAAIEAADIVLMDDKPSKIAQGIRLARRTMTIVWQNIWFALVVKFAILVLAAVGIATMWLAVFGDVGVAIICILNAMRCMNVKRFTL